VGLHTAIDTLKQEKSQVIADQKKFRDYRLGHHRRLRDLHVNLREQ
jgi:hypothetical protein